MGSKKGVKTGRKKNWWFRGQRLTDEQMDLITELDLSYHCIQSRLSRGEDLQTAITQPLQRKKKACLICGAPATIRRKYIREDMELTFPLCKEHDFTTEISGSVTNTLELLKNIARGQL